MTAFLAAAPVPTKTIIGCSISNSRFQHISNMFPASTSDGSRKIHGREALAARRWFYSALIAVANAGDLPRRSKTRVGRVGVVAPDERRMGGADRRRGRRPAAKLRRPAARWRPAANYGGGRRRSPQPPLAALCGAAIFSGRR